MPNLNLKNFAKIKDANFDISNITVFVGKPSTGKSYVMKTLYAIEEALHKAKSDIAQAKRIMEELKKNSNAKKLKSQLKLIMDILKSYPEINDDNHDAKMLTAIYRQIFESIFGNLHQISDNFEITNEYVKLKFYNGILGTKIIDQENDYISDNVVFLETPLILEFKQFINRIPGKTPYHIESLLNILDKDYSFTDTEQDEFIKSFTQKTQEIIKGDIKNSGDSLLFSTQDKDFAIINASSGTKSIGLLQYLVTNKALKKDSALFWEEPEVHLHPSWQLKMIDLFVELMKAGVKITFSTHSPYMADYLNAKSQKEGFRDKVSFNLLSESNGVVNNTVLNDENWNLLQKELLEPLEDVMWQYL